MALAARVGGGKGGGYRKCYSEIDNTSQQCFGSISLGLSSSFVVFFSPLCFFLLDRLTSHTTNIYLVAKAIKTMLCLERHV